MLQYHEAWKRLLPVCSITFFLMFLTPNASSLEHQAERLHSQSPLYRIVIPPDSVKAIGKQQWEQLVSSDKESIS